MADSRPENKYRNLLRFYGFVVPHWKTWALALMGMMLYSLVSFNFFILVRPMVKAFEAQEAGGRQAQPQEGEPALPGDAPATAGANPFKDQVQKVKAWFLGIPGVRTTVDWLWPGEDLEKIALFLACFVGPLLFISGFLRHYAQSRVAWAVMADVRMAVFRQLSGLSLAFFSDRRSGDIVSRLTNDMFHSRKALKVIFGKVFMQPLMMVVFLLLAVYYSWELTIIALVSFPIVAVMTGRYGKRIARYGLRTLEKLGDITDSLTQLLNGIRVVKSFNMEEAENEEFEGRNRAQLDRAYKLVKNRALATALPESFLAYPTALALMVGHYLVTKERLEFAEMVACCAALVAMRGPIRRVVIAYNEVQEALGGVDRIFELIDAEPEIEDSPSAVDLPGVREGVRFGGVAFSYDRAPVLEGIDLFVPRGKTYAIVGETGAGKTSLLDLIPRFYDVTEGSVTIDGVDVRQIKREGLMRNIAIVGQHPFLFNRSVEENMRYGKPEATDEEVVAAAKAANIHAFIESMPQGYQTVVGEAGDRLSGGQRQCVTIARAILKDAPILILDEATSSLDAESERLVQQALNNLMKGRTTFVIAHRLSTVRHADRIVVLKEGRIVEQGTHEELLASSGEYERLYRLQFADAPLDAEVERNK